MNPDSMPKAQGYKSKIITKSGNVIEAFYREGEVDVMTMLNDMEKYCKKNNTFSYSDYGIEEVFFNDKKIEPYYQIPTNNIELYFFEG